MYMEIIKHHSKRFVYPIKGILFALRKDRSYRFQFYGVAIVLSFFIYFLRPLSQTEMLFIGLSYALILITELQNSSFEAALDRLHPEIHEDIGHSKDMAAGAVLTAGFFLIFVLVLVWLY